MSRAALQGATIALAVSGSIAAYKALELARLLVTAGARVLPVMTPSAARFVGAVTMSGICREAVATDMWAPSFAGEMHVALADRADAIVIAPATADILARLAHGRADDLVTALALCASGPVLVAPAMHPRMWHHPAVQRNVSDLGAQARVTLVGPAHGEVASGDVGLGRMVEPSVIVAALDALLSPRDLAGMCIVVTAGPTLEDIDPVRFLGNRSTGRMGFAVASRAAARGAHVILIAGPVNLPTPLGVERVDVRGALAMRSALWDRLGPDLKGADALVMAAAVADHRPARVSEEKLKKRDVAVVLELVANPDLLAEVGAARTGSRPVLVGFAVESDPDALLAYAERKRVEKRVDLIVANEAQVAFGGDANRVILVTATGAEPLAPMPKVEVADRVLDRVRALASEATDERGAMRRG